MSSFFGENLKLSVFGQSHGKAIGMVLDGVPAGLPVDPEALGAFLRRRAPGNASWATPRKEADAPEFLSGLLDGFTCGAPISALIHNTNTRSSDYSQLKTQPRPGHADYTAQVKYGGFQDAAGGGHFSGRLTAPLCIAGGLCKQWLEEMDIRIAAHITRIGSVQAPGFDPVEPELDRVGQVFPTLTGQTADRFREEIEKARDQGNSVGGQVECAVTGLPAGLGEPMFAGVESRIAQIVYGIPGVKALGFGLGEAFAQCLGTESNDAFRLRDGVVVTETNRCGGILGGITNGMPVLFRVTFKPTPSLSQPQDTVDLATGRETTLQVRGRHDPCIVPRGVPVVEAAAALAIFDLILGNTQTQRRK